MRLPATLSTHTQLRDIPQDEQTMPVAPPPPHGSRKQQGDKEPAGDNIEKEMAVKGWGDLERAWQSSPVEATKYSHKFSAFPSHSTLSGLGAR